MIIFTSLCQISYFYLLICLVALASWPLVFYFFPHFSDRAWGLAKTFGLVTSAWLLWYLASLKLVPFSNLTVWLSVLLLFVFCWLLLGKNLLSKTKDKKQVLKKVFFQEVLFFVVFILLCLARGFYPGINNVEKPMDFAFVNSILRSRFFPPTDPWLAGHPINYYYFGHYFTAFLVKFSFLSPSLVFNLMSVLVIILSGQGLFSIGSWLTGNFGGGWLSCFFAVLSGNLHFFLRGRWDVDIGTGKYFYPRATRIVPNLINEFPAYSLLLGDLHAHVLGLPLFVLGIGWLSGSFSVTKDLNKKRKYFLLVRAIIFGIILAIAAMTNSWDAITLVALLGFLSIFLLISKRESVTQVFWNLLLSGLFAILGCLPFLISFSSPVGGVGLVHTHTPFDFYFVFFGGQFIFILSSFLVFAIPSWRKNINLSLNKILKHDKALLIAALLIFSFLLMLVPEVFYLKDIFSTANPPYFRTNTMFKIHFQAWVLLSLVAVVLWWKGRFFAKNILLKILLSLVAVFLIFAQGIYIFQGFKDASDNWKHFYGLDGRRILIRDHPGDAYAIDWLQGNIKGQPIILEAVGPSYTNYARVSSWTGLPTVLGWPTHQWQWRGSYEPYQRLESLVRDIYQTTNIEKARGQLALNNISYLYIGSLEKTAYPQLNMVNLTLLGEVIYNSDTVVIIKVYAKNE